MNTHDIELPPEFQSGNSVPVSQATIKRERMEEILRAAIEADRQRRGEPVKVVSDDEVLEAMRPSLDEGDGGYVCDMSPMHVIASGRALLARYGQPVESEGWQLVPKEPTKEMLINAMEASLLGRPSPDDDSYVRSIVSAWCEAAPKFGEEE